MDYDFSIDKERTEFEHKTSSEDGVTNEKLGQERIVVYSDNNMGIVILPDRVMNGQTRKIAGVPHAVAASFLELVTKKPNPHWEFEHSWPPDAGGNVAFRNLHLWAY